MEKSEQEVIRRVLAGERDLYRVLMERHRPAVLRVSLRITGNPVDAEEAAQEAFLRAYNGLPRFREQAAFGTWVYRIAMNCSIHLVERRSRDPGWNAIRIHGVEGETCPVVSPRSTPEEALLDREALMQRERAMRTLTPMERTAFVLRHLEEQPMDVIAGALDISTNAVKQAVFRAVGKLRRALAPVQPVYPAATVTASLVKENR